MSRTGRGRGRARAEIAVVRVLEKRLGALPVVAEFGRRLRIAEIVDELCPVRPVAWISLYGAYPQADQEYPAPRWGHPKDRRPDLRQIQTGLAVSGDGGIPLFHQAYDGGAAEVSQVVGAMTALKQIAGPRPFLLVGD